MSNIMETDAFRNSIDEYKLREKQIGRNFLKGVIELGKILNTQRSKWAPKGRWIEYLEEVEKSLAGANQYIRLYQYSKNNMEVLEKADITNWSKANSFLAIPEDIKLKMAEEVDGIEIASKEFSQKVEQIKTESMVDEYVVEEVSMSGESNIMIFQRELDSILSKEISLPDSQIKGLSKKIIDATIVDTSISKNSRLKTKRILQGVLKLDSALTELDEGIGNNMTKEEQGMWLQTLSKLNAKFARVIIKKF